jgi:hypothetical protein
MIIRCSKTSSCCVVIDRSRQTIHFLYSDGALNVASHCETVNDHQQIFCSQALLSFVLLGDQLEVSQPSLLAFRTQV